MFELWVLVPMEGKTRLAHRMVDSFGSFKKARKAAKANGPGRYLVTDERGRKRRLEVVAEVRELPCLAMFHACYPN